MKSSVLQDINTMIFFFQVRMHPGVTVENSKGQKDELIVQGKGTFRYYVNAQTGEVSCVFTTIFDS